MDDSSGGHESCKSVVILVNAAITTVVKTVMTTAEVAVAAKRPDEFSFDRDSGP